MAASGIVPFAALDTSAAGAYRSIAAFSEGMGGPVRSLHRYAADAFVATAALHLLREAMLGRFAHFRRYTWLTGVVLVPLAFVAAIGGFWLAWDRQGQFSAVATAEWLDALPLLATPLTRNFIGNAAVTDRLFSLFVFVHLGVALLLVFGFWAHLQRLVRAAVWPPPALLAGTLLALLALVLAWPVRGAGPADLATEPSPLALDWWLLAPLALMNATSASLLWTLSLALLAGLFALPWLARQPKPVPAVVHPQDCNGCRRCFDDCPYAAITMVQHPLRARRELARVDTDLCAGCGICTGACPSSTPLRSAATLHTGIDMPQQPIDTLRRRLREGLRALRGPRRIVVFGCERGAALPAADDVLALPLLCVGMLPPAFIEDALRQGADAVVVAGCRSDGCEYRLGMRWTADRLQRRREPRLRARVAVQALHIVQADAGETRPLQALLAQLRRSAA